MDLILQFYHWGQPRVIARHLDEFYCRIDRLIQLINALLSKISADSHPVDTINKQQSASVKLVADPLHFLIKAVQLETLISTHVLKSDLGAVLSQQGAPPLFGL